MPNEFAALKPVESSMFSRAGYDEATWALLLEFKSTHEIRSYRGVSPETADEALSAKSLGRWWNANVKGNSSWEYDVLGADPSQMPEPPKAKPAEALEVIDEDIRLVEPRWNGHSIDPLAPQVQQATILDAQPIKDGEIPRTVAEADYFGVKAFDPETGHWPSEVVNEDGTVKEEAITAIVRQPVGEVLAAWTAPESAAEALDLLAEREGEIKAIIQRNKEVGAQALAINVSNVETHAVAGKELTSLVSTKDATVKILDPFRSQLYEAYKDVQQLSKSAVDPLDSAITHLKRIMGAWEFEQDRIRKEEARKAREAADAEARRLQEAEAERIRLADVQDKLDEGDEAGAQMLFEAPLIEVPRPYVAPAPVQPTDLPPAGQSVRANWKIDEESIDLVVFLRAVKDGKIDLEVAARFVLPNIPALNKQAKSLESTFNVPGFRAINEPVRSVRRGK